MSGHSRAEGRWGPRSLEAGRVAGLPRDIAGKTRMRLALELVADLERLHTRKKAANKHLLDLVRATGTGLLEVEGIGPQGAAGLLVEVGDISRFPDRNHFASWTGTAPLDASPATTSAKVRSLPLCALSTKALQLILIAFPVLPGPDLA
jgi:transposase